MPFSMKELRLSFIWMESFPALLLAPSAKTPMAFLGEQGQYMEEFEKVKASTSELTAPWPHSGGKRIHRFWKFYLKRDTLDNIESERAWKRLVPLRKSIKAPIKAPWLPGRVFLEGFYYPHGVALVVTVILNADLTLEKMVDKAIEVRTTGTYEVTWQDGSVETLNLDALASQALDRLHETALGNGVPQGERSGTPFTIGTVVKGAGANPKKSNQAKGKVHRALEGLCSWHQSWKSDDLHDLNDSTSLKKRNAPKSHLLYGLKRGRAVWFPDPFMQTGKVHSMGCYHRNLTLASLQTESLVALMRLTADYVSHNKVMPASLENLANYAAGILGQLYGAVQDTYQSCSPRAQIDGNQYIEAIDKVRQFFGMDKLGKEAKK